MEKFFKNPLLMAAVIPLLAGTVSCSGSQTEEDAVTEDLKIVLSANVIEANGVDEVTFSVEYDGIDVTSESVIYSAQDDAEADLPDMKFTTETPGTYSFYAVYSSMRSETVTITALESSLAEIPEDPQPGSTDFVRKVLLLQFTGIGCSFCPSSDAAIDRLMDTPLRNSFVHVACHSRERDDPAWYGGPLKNVFGADTTPYVVIDLDENICHEGGCLAASLNALTSEYDFLISSAMSLRPAKAAIAASSAAGDGSIVVSVSVKASETGEYKVGAWLVEDGIFGRQVNGTGISGNFDTHDNCLRYADYSGDGSSADYTGHSLGTVDAGESYEYTFSIETDSSWDIENCHLVLFVCSKEGNGFYVTNAATCEIGGTLAYEYN